MSNFANPELDTFARRIILPSNTATAPSLVFANDLTKGLYWLPDGIHLSGIATPTNADDVANKAYVDGAVGGSGATIALDNLVAVAVNTHFDPGTDDSFDLGNASFRWRNLTLSSRISFPDGVNQIGIFAADDFRVEASSGHTTIQLKDAQININADDKIGIRVDGSTTSGNTRFMLYDVDNATLERVSVGAADSGGSGFKVLRIPN